MLRRVRHRHIVNYAIYMRGKSLETGSRPVTVGGWGRMRSDG